MKKGEASKQRLICCAAELFWKNGYSATGVNEILDLAQLPKGSFYFYFKSKDELAEEVVSYYQSILLDRFRGFAVQRDWIDFVNAVFDHLLDQTEHHAFFGCPFAVMGIETALYKPELAGKYMEGFVQLQELFYHVLLQSGLSQEHAKILSQRFLAVYQGDLLLCRISGDIFRLDTARNALITMYREYRSFYHV